MATVLDLIKSTRLLLNIDAVGDTPSADEAQDNFDDLNFLIDSWNTQRLTIPNMKDITCTLQANHNPHTLGTSVGTDINVDRFLRVERAFTRTPGVTSPVDFPIEIVSSARYQEFTVKSIGTNYPTHLYYEPAFPVASIYLFPVQTTALELHLSVWSKLAQFNTINDTISLPEGYYNALRHSLAVEIGPKFGKPQTKGMAIYDRAAKLLKGLNSVNQEEKHAVLDLAMVNNQSHGFQIYRGF